MDQEENELLKYIEKESFQKIKLLSGKSIGIRKWIIEEEKDFLFAVETQMDNRELLIEKSLELSRKCVNDGKLFDTLSRNDLVYVLSKQRALSKGEEITFSFKCNNDKCQDYQEFSQDILDGLGPNEPKGEGQTVQDDIVNLRGDIITKEFDNKPIEIGKFKIYPKEVSWDLQYKLEKKFITDKEPKLTEMNWEFVLASIGEIEIEEKKINFDHKTLSKFIGALDSRDFVKLSDELAERTSTYQIDKKVSCVMCQKENTVVYDEIFSIMVF